jgi:hypothetical protein
LVDDIVVIKKDRTQVDEYNSDGKHIKQTIDGKELKEFSRVELPEQMKDTPKTK